jgi:UDP-N-acetylmuramate: L-alanyl-gamma-D-glutamyl-meso-diaminopimelate ligase
MAAAAAAMLDKGFQVTGSDGNVYEPVASFLASKNILISGYDERNLAHKPDLVVIGNAISRGNAEAEYALDHRLRYCSLPELLREFFIRDKRSIVVSGTHGKTTTTSLLTWVFEHNGLNPSYLIGGIPNNFSQGARFTDSEWFIIEGDEYDTAFFDKRSKFIHYQPEVAIINNLEYDHADIFENLAAIKKTFSHFIRLVPRNGLLLGNGDDPNLAPLLNVTHCPVKKFGLGGDYAVMRSTSAMARRRRRLRFPVSNFIWNWAANSTCATRSRSSARQNTAVCRTSKSSRRSPRSRASSDAWRSRASPAA